MLSRNCRGRGANHAAIFRPARLPTNPSGRRIVLINRSKAHGASAGNQRQRAAREQREEQERRKWSRNIHPPDLDRSTVGRRIDDDDDEGVADFEESDQIVIRHLGRRW